jgi:hypothetical protein
MVGSLTSGGSAARWSAKRWLYVWRGRLYLTAGATDVEPLVTKTYWRGYKVVLVPPKVRLGLWWMSTGAMPLLTLTLVCHVCVQMLRTAGLVVNHLP